MKESDIRPEDLYQRYLKLSHEDAEKCFGDEERFDLPCVACGSGEVEYSFTKLGFEYVECQNCGTLYQNPRPSLASFEAFYKDSVSSNYWADVFFPATAEKRRESIFRPRVERLYEIANENGVNVSRLIDVGAGYGIFIDEWRKLDPKTNIIAVEPSSSLAAECRRKGFETSENIVEEVEGYDDFADLAVCFEVLEHVHDPVSFIKSIKSLVRPGGLVFISTLSIDGFDLRTLWDKSNQIFPPHHINFLSVKGFNRLFERSGLCEINVTTPGKLDVDIIKNAKKNHPELFSRHRFLDNLIRDDKLANSFQEFLANNSLSSHAWVVGKVPV